MVSEHEGHLCLSRHKDESVTVLVGDVKIAEVMVSSIRGDRVILRMIADKTVKFVRSELCGQGDDKKDEGGRRAIQ